MPYPKSALLDRVLNRTSKSFFVVPIRSLSNYIISPSLLSIRLSLLQLPLSPQVEAIDNVSSRYHPLRHRLRPWNSSPRSCLRIRTVRAGRRLLSATAPKTPPSSPPSSQATARLSLAMSTSESFLFVKWILILLLLHVHILLPLKRTSGFLLTVFPVELHLGPIGSPF